MQSLLLLASATLCTAIWSSPLHLAPDGDSSCDKAAVAKCERLHDAIFVSCAHAEKAKEVQKDGGYQVPNYCTRISHKESDTEACNKIVEIARAEFETKNATSLFVKMEDGANAMESPLSRNTIYHADGPFPCTIMMSNQTLADQYSWQTCARDTQCETYAHQTYQQLPADAFAEAMAAEEKLVADEEYARVAAEAVAFVSEKAGN